MKVNCLSCGHELNLDHWVFDNYEGPVKCFSCSSMMEVKSAEGTVYSINPLSVFETERNMALIETLD
jgi:hypothetical protein